MNHLRNFCWISPNLLSNNSYYIGILVQNDELHKTWDVVCFSRTGESAVWQTTQPLTFWTSLSTKSSAAFDSKDRWSTTRLSHSLLLHSRLSEQQYICILYEGIIFLLLSKNLLIRVLSKGNWKLICLNWHILTVVHNFVEAPLVT